MKLQAFSKFSALGIPIILLLCISCWRLGSSESPLPGSSPVVYYRNNQGQDLLNPNVLGHFDQSTIMVSWINPDGSIGAKTPAIILNYSYNPSIPFLPSGYSLNLSLNNNNGNNGKGIVSNNKATAFIILNDSVRDTLVYNFSNNLSLQSFTVNNKLISPPQNMSSYPPVFPVIINK